MSDISTKTISELRQRTGAGLIDCKQALTECNGNMDEAITWLKKKGIASAAKKAGREAQEGLVHAYLHFGGKLGVLVEVNCETDFVARNEEFKQLVNDLCMHIAASAPTYIQREEVPAEFIQKEKEIATAQCADKPSAAIEKIVEGKLNKFYSENCLLEQPFVKNQTQTIRELLNEKITKTGENIIVRRFVRHQIGN